MGVSPAGLGVLSLDSLKEFQIGGLTKNRIGVQTLQLEFLLLTIVS